MKKSIKKNYIYNLAYQLMAIIVPLITTPYLARIFGANGTGIYSYTISIVTYFILFGSLGIAMYGQREIAYVQHNKEKQSKVFKELVLLRFITMMFSIIIFWISFAKSGIYSDYYKILILELFASCFDISWYYQGIEEFKKITIRNSIIRIISLISIFLFVKKSSDLSIYVFIYCLTNFLGNFTLWFNINKYIEYTKVSFSNILKHLKPTLLLFIPQIAIQVYTVLDKTMIGNILKDTTEVGYYEQSQKIVKILLTIITSASIIMLSRIANCFALKQTKKIKEYMIKTFNFSFFIVFPMTLGICAVSTNFVPLFFGKGYDKVITLMPILSLVIIFISMSTTTGSQYLLPLKRQKEYTYSVLAGALVNFILNAILIRLYKSIGAAIATVLAEAVVTSIQLYFIRKDFSLKTIAKKAINYIFASIIMFIVCKLVGTLPFSNILSLLLQVLVGMITYIVILYIIGDEILKYVINGFMQLIKKIFFKIKKV